MLLALFFTTTSYAEIIRGIHVTATGNNPYECKIRANYDGMRQTLAIIADEIGVKNASFSTVPYLDLKAVFSVNGIISEASYDEKYTADVNYAYTYKGVNDLILKYGTDAVKKQFFDYVVIPVFKQKNVISFLDTKTEWLQTWIDSTEECTKHRLLPIDPTTNSSKISTNNVFSLSYVDFLNDLKIKKFKNVLIATCEYFTRDDGTMYFQVTTEELTPTSKNISEVKHDIANPDNAKDYFDAAIERIIAIYGDKNQYNITNKNTTDATYASERIIATDGSKKAGSVLDALLAQPKIGKKLTKVEMRLDVFSKEDLEHIKLKLKQVKPIVKFQIDLDDESHYKIALYISGSMEDLAEGFYENDLSYRVYDNEYVMFELESGI